MATTASAISWSPCLSSGGKQQQAKCVPLTFLTTRNTSVSVNSAAAPSSLLHCSFIPSSPSSALSLSLPSSFSGLSLGLDLSTNVGVGRRSGSGVVVRAERSAPPRPEKKRSRSPNQTTEVAAYAKFVRISAHKARRVVDQIRGRSYEESLMILELMPYRACDAVLKLVYSAAANASHNKGLNKASLIVSKAEVSEGKTVKKLRCRARGRGVPVRRSNCHITIFLKDVSVDEQL